MGCDVIASAALEWARKGIEWARKGIEWAREETEWAEKRSIGRLKPGDGDALSNVGTTVYCWSEIAAGQSKGPASGKVLKDPRKRLSGKEGAGSRRRGWSAKKAGGRPRRWQTSRGMLAPLERVGEAFYRAGHEVFYGGT